MKYIAVFIIMLCLAPIARAEDGPPSSGSAALLCKMSHNSQMTTQTLALDYEQKTVNGLAATFTPSAIFWVVKNGPDTQNHELNRITGNYTFWTENGAAGEPLPTYTCEKAPAKF